MRKPLWVLLTALFLVLVVPNAQADLVPYSATLTCSGTCMPGTSDPTSPGMTFTTPTGPISPFSVTWNDIVFSDFTLPANAQPNDEFTWEAIYNQSNAYGRGDFTITDVSLPIGGPLRSSERIVTFQVSSQDVVNFLDYGTLSFAPVATPEPGSLALTMIGLASFGLLLVMKKAA